MTTDKNSGVTSPNISQSNRPARRPKPLVEGINTPVTKPAVKIPVLTKAEKVLVESTDNSFGQEQIEPKKTSPRITVLPPEGKKRRGLGLTAVLLIILVIASGVGYYFWQLRQIAKQTPDTNTPISTLPVPSQNTQNTSTASSTASSTAVTTASTTVTTGEVGKNVNDLFGKQTQLTIKKTPTGYLNVRSQPTSSSKLVAKVSPGDTYVYTATKNGWYQITLKDNSTGWVIGTYVTVNK